MNFSELSKRADSALLHLLNSYYVATGGTLHRFTGYGTIGEIIVPSEVLSAKELDDKAKEILSTHVVQFVTDSMQRFKEVASNEKN